MRPAEQKIRITVRVTPRAARTAVASYDGVVLVVRVTAPPVDSAANAACIELVARSLGVRPGQVTVAVGLHSRNKVLEVTGIGPEEAAGKLRLAAGAAD